jgi:hypothetical protein
MRYLLFVGRPALPIAALLFCVFGGLGGARAQGDTPDVRQACTPDAMRLCGDVIPDVPKITACMKAKRAQLSAECRLAMAGGAHGGGHGHRGGGGHREHSHHSRHHHAS